MLKSKAIELLGGTPTAAADAIGISVQAIGQWPDELPRRISDRVEAALWRRANAKVDGEHPRADDSNFSTFADAADPMDSVSAER